MLSPTSHNSPPQHRISVWFNESFPCCLHPEKRKLPATWPCRSPLRTSAGPSLFLLNRLFFLAATSPPPFSNHYGDCAPPLLISLSDSPKAASPVKKSVNRAHFFARQMMRPFVFPMKRGASFFKKVYPSPLHQHHQRPAKRPPFPFISIKRSAPSAKKNKTQTPARQSPLPDNAHLPPDNSNSSPLIEILINFGSTGFRMRPPPPPPHLATPYQVSILLVSYVLFHLRLSPLFLTQSGLSRLTPPFSPL